MMAVSERSLCSGGHPETIVSVPFPRREAQVHHESLGIILRDADLHHLPKFRYSRGGRLRLVPGGTPAFGELCRRGDYGDGHAEPVNSAQMDSSLGVDFVYSLQWIAEKGDTTDRGNAV